MRPRGRGPSIPHLYPVSLSDYGTDMKPQKSGAASSSLNFCLSASTFPPNFPPSLMLPSICIPRILEWTWSWSTAG